MNCSTNQFKKLQLVPFFLHAIHWRSTFLKQATVVGCSKRGIHWDYSGMRCAQYGLCCQTVTVGHMPDWLVEVSIFFILETQVSVWSMWAKLHSGAHFPEICGSRCCCFYQKWSTLRDHRIASTGFFHQEISLFKNNDWDRYIIARTSRIPESLAFRSSFRN